MGAVDEGISTRQFDIGSTAYVDFILERVKQKNSDGSLVIMSVCASASYILSQERLKGSEDRYTIHGEKIFPEIELNHLDGHKGSKPVRCALSLFLCEECAQLT